MTPAVVCLDDTMLISGLWIGDDPHLWTYHAFQPQLVPQDLVCGGAST